MTAHYTLNGLYRRLPVIKLDGKLYFITGGTYQRLHNEQVITERYTRDGDIDRQKMNTNKHRWKFTILVPSSYSTVDVNNGGSSTDVGDLDTLHATAYKAAPNDLLGYYDITANEVFTGSYTHYVYMKMDWETPMNNDPGNWQVPIELWGYNA